MNPEGAPKPMLRPYIIIWAIAVHIAWGVALLVDPAAAPAVILIGLHWMISYGVDGPGLGVALLLAAGLALLGLLLGRRLSNLKALALLMPQFALLVAALISDSQSVFTGVLPDGREVDRVLLFTALWPTMIAAVLHSVAIVERHSAWTRR